MTPTPSIAPLVAMIVGGLVALWQLVFVFIYAVGDLLIGQTGFTKEELAEGEQYVNVSDVARFIQSTALHLVLLASAIVAVVVVSRLNRSGHRPVIWVIALLLALIVPVQLLMQ